MNDPAGAARIRVMVVDDHAVVRTGIQAYLAAQPDLQVVAEAGDGQAALDLLENLLATTGLPDVVLMDVVMPGMDGVTAAEHIRERHPGVQTVILTSFGELTRVRRAIQVGVAGYLLKDAAPSEIVAAVRAAAKGEMHLDGQVTRRLAQQLVAPTDPLATLSARERDILVLVAAGRSNRQIATELTISERTARTHVSNILAKLQLSSRTQAALLAIQQGLVTLPTT